MRLLVDENLSRVARLLREDGHDAAHVIEVGLGNTDDPLILGAAADDARIIVTADTDFRALLAARRPGVSFVNADLLAAQRWPDPAEARRRAADAAQIAHEAREQLLPDRRVARRVQPGGPPVPEANIRARHQRL